MRGVSFLKERRRSEPVILSAAGAKDLLFLCSTSAGANSRLFARARSARAQDDMRGVSFFKERRRSEPVILSAAGAKDLLFE